MGQYEAGEVLAHEESLNRKKLRIVNVVSFLMGFAQSAVIYIMSSYFKEISGTENVGVFYFLAYAIALFALLNLHKLVRGIGKSGVFHLALFLKIVAVACVMILPPSPSILFFLILYLIFSTLEWAGLDSVLESFSVDKMSGRIRGKHWTMVNAGFLLAPFLSANIVERFGFNGVFLLLFIMSSAIFIISILGFGKINHASRGEVKVRDIFEKVRGRKNVLRIYYISFALEFFYALMIIYTPIYLLDLGLSWEQIGLVFTIMLIPFVLVAYPVGFIADKKLGEKEGIIFSLIIMAVSTGLIYFMNIKAVLIWALVLFATRIGAAMLETLRDSYFYKRIDSQDVDLINFFRTAMPLGYIAGTALSVLILLILPMPSIFILIALVVFSALYPAVRLVDNKCEKELCPNTK